MSAFAVRTQEGRPSRGHFHSLRRACFLRLLSNLFSFRPVRRTLQQCIQLVSRRLCGLFPGRLTTYGRRVRHFRSGIAGMTRGFDVRCAHLVSATRSCTTSPALRKHVRSTTACFRRRLRPLSTIVTDAMASSGGRLGGGLQSTVRRLRRIFSLGASLLSCILRGNFRITKCLGRGTLLSVSSSTSRGNGNGKEDTSTGRKRKDDGRTSGRGHPHRQGHSTTTIRMPASILRPRLCGHLMT